MDLALNPEQQLLQDTVRAFAQHELVGVAAALDEAGVFPTAQVQRMAELGLMGMRIPVTYGGSGMDMVSYCLAIEELSAGCASCGVIMSVNNSLAADPLVRFGTEAQKRLWLGGLAQGQTLGCFALSEPNTGSDAAAQTTVARRRAEHWVIDGTKNFITNGAEAAVCILFAMGDKAQGVHGINAYVVPTSTPGFHVVKNEHKLGIRASSTSQIVLENMVLPAESLLGQVGEGFKIAMSTLDGGRIGIAAQALGIARAAYEEAAAYASQRHAFGKPLAHFQAIQFMLADMATELEAARLLTWQAAWLRDQGKPFGTAAAMAKLYASEMSHRVTHQALQVYGGYGYCKDFPAERHLRDARITELYEGTSEIQRLVIARSLLKTYLADVP